MIFPEQILRDSFQLRMRPVETLAPLNPEHPEIYILKTRNFRPFHREVLASFLSAEELAKSRRFRFQNDRESYVVTHGMLRLILGRHLGIEPGSVDLVYNHFGKPLISPGYQDVFFNLSHSSEVSVLAFDLKGNIGVDVEHMGPDVDFQSIAQQFFTRRETEYINSTETCSARRFYQLWTRKEALLKALGIGISANLDIEVLPEHVTSDPDEPLRLTVHPATYLLRTWTFEEAYMITSSARQDSGRPGYHVLGKDHSEFLIS
jgi:phosphopantetheine--protein transferase-like protein